MPGYLDLARAALAAFPPEPARPGYEQNEKNELIPAWDQAAAGRLLAELRAEVAAVEAVFGGRTPAPLATAMADALAIAEGYVANHDLEARRGWDALALLRGVAPLVRRCVQNWMQARGPAGAL
jgi:hypothetical protein